MYLVQEDPLEEGMATHSRTLAWESPLKEEPGGLQSMGSQKSDMTYLARESESQDLAKSWTKLNNNDATILEVAWSVSTFISSLCSKHIFPVNLMYQTESGVAFA